MHQQIRKLVKDRDAALLSLDRSKILAYARTYGIPELEQATEEVFWISVHKARTAATSLPEYERQKSRDWLRARGYQSVG